MNDATIKHSAHALSALAKACYFNQVAGVKQVLDHAKPTNSWINNQVDKNELGEQREWTGPTTTCLCLACRYSSVAIVKLLVRHGAGVSVTNSAGNTPLHRACRSKRDVMDKVAYLLFEDVTLVNIQNVNNETALHIACSYASAEVVMRLVKNGANLYQVKDKYEDTPLYRATSTNIDLVEKLNFLLEILHTGVKSTKSKKTHKEITKAFTSSETVKGLLDSGLVLDPTKKAKK